LNLFGDSKSKMSADIEMGPVFVSDLQPLIEEEVEVYLLELSTNIN
jgi:hypothetical protein